MRVHVARKNKIIKTGTPLPPPLHAPRRVPMPSMPMRPTTQPRRIPGKGGR